MNMRNVECGARNTHTPNSELRTPNSRRRAFSLVEIMVLAGSIMLVTQIGVSAHRWMWHQAELVRYRSAMQDVTDTIRAMRVRSLTKRQITQLRIDASRGGLQVVAIQGRWGGHIETVERTLWLPHGLEISDAPAVVTSQPSGALSDASIIVMAPLYQRAFRVTIDHAGQVRLDEEPTS